jgi:hypothetical protein
MIEEQNKIKEAYKNYFDNIQKLNQELLDNIKKKMPELEELLEKIKGHWYYEDMIYRFFHNSFKVYHVQEDTCQIVELLKSLAPEGITFNAKFELIFKEGTGKKFQSSHNKEWEKHTRPMIEAFLHAKFFLEMAVKYGKKLEEAPLPCILHWNNNHYVVLYKAKKNKFYVSDPAHGLLEYNEEDFLKFWIGNNFCKRSQIAV